MRRTVLLRSISQVLGDETTVTEAAYMWIRHRHMVPFSIVAFVALVVAVAMAGTDDWPTRIVFGAAGSAVAVASTTQYRVIADTDTGLVLLRASRIRQYATELIGPVDSGTTIAPVGGTVFANDWQIGDVVYTVPRSSEQAIERIGSMYGDD